MNPNSGKIIIASPVFNDWECLIRLLPEIKSEMEKGGFTDFKFVVIDDGSTIEKPEDLPDWVSIIELHRNVGHQKAIAIGLSYISEVVEDAEVVVVMDADGEDLPAQIPVLVEEVRKGAGNKIVLAKRRKRHEGLLFKFMYLVYKFIFQLLVGVEMNFGNFCAIPFSQLRRLTHISGIWNHFPGGIIRSRIPYLALPLDRGYRLTGKSKMNVTSLVIHGLSSLAVHLDKVSVRMLFLSGSLLGLLGLGVVALLGFRFFADAQIPSWLTFLTFISLNLLIMLFLFCVFLVFLVLSYRSNRQFIPAVHYQDFVHKVLNDLKV